MSHTEEEAASAAVGIGIGLCVPALLIWALTLAFLANLAGSDAAGNAYAQAYAALAVIVLWLLLVALGIIAVLKGVMPRPAAVITAPPSGPSARNASVPAKKRPTPDCHQGLAGMAIVANPKPTSVMRIPVSLVIGGSGSLRSSIARRTSMPDS